MLSVSEIFTAEYVTFAFYLCCVTSSGAAIYRKKSEVSLDFISSFILPPLRASKKARRRSPNHFPFIDIGFLLSFWSFHYYFSSSYEHLYAHFSAHRRPSNGVGSLKKRARDSFSRDVFHLRLRSRRRRRRNQDNDVVTNGERTTKRPFRKSHFVHMNFFRILAISLRRKSHRLVCKSD